MSRILRRGLFLALPLIVQLGGCALTSKGTPLDIRYFSPEPVELRAARVPAPPLPSPGDAPVIARGRLRMGDLTSSANLRYAIVHRESAVEVAPYDTLRWTENPEDYVRRSLSRALFEDGPLDEVVGGAASTLDIEVIAFEEIKRGPRHFGRVQLGYHLHDERVILASGVVTVEREASSSAIESVVAAIGAAMDGATAEVAKKVVARVRSP